MEGPRSDGKGLGADSDCSTASGSGMQSRLHGAGTSMGSGAEGLGAEGDCSTASGSGTQTDATAWGWDQHGGRRGGAGGRKRLLHRQQLWHADRCDCMGLGPAWGAEGRGWGTKETSPPPAALARRQMRLHGAGTSMGGGGEGLGDERDFSTASSSGTQTDATAWGWDQHGGRRGGAGGRKRLLHRQQLWHADRCDCMGLGPAWGAAGRG